MILPVSEPRMPFRPGDDLPQEGAPNARAAIAPLLAGYLAFGLYWGTWVILVFEFQRAHGFSDSSLGLHYAILSITSIAVISMIAPRLQPVPLSVVLPISLGSLGIASVMIAYASGWLLVPAFALVGAGSGLIDVFMNVAAQKTEVLVRKPVLQWMHASYAVGGIVGAAIAAGVLVGGHHWFRFGIAIPGLSLLATGIWNARTAPSTRNEPARSLSLSVSALFRSPGLWVPALIVLFAFLVEGSMDTWSGLYLRTELHATATAASVAFIAFSAAVAFGRLFAGRVLFGLGLRRTVLVAGFGAAAGGALTIATSDPAIVAIAFLILGFALASAGPAGFGLVGRSDEDPTHAIAAVTTIGYTGFIWSPPLLGWLAQTFSLRFAMAAILVATLGIIAAGFAAPRDA
jgi:hypothetical protein